MICHGISKPLYLQLKELLVEQIESGKYLAGDVLPGERTLAVAYDVSRVTVRKCIEMMTEEGFLTRSAGKEAIVTNRKISHRLGNLLGIREELLEISKDIQVVELFKGFETVQHEVKRLLDLREANEVYAFARLFLVEKKPILVNYSYISSNKSKLIEVMDLSKVVVFSHLENYGYNISYAEQEIIAGICTADEGKYLNYAEGFPILVRKRTTYLEGGYPILYDKCIYRGDSYQYSIKLNRNRINK